MQLLLLSPNISEAVRSFSPRPRALEPLRARRVIPLTAQRAEAQIAGAVVLEALAEYHGTYDTAIIAIFR